MRVEVAERLRAVRVVLARPADAENIGSVCRAMKTMGIVDLRIVGATGFDDERARVVAVHANDVLAEASYTESIAEAVSGCALVAGTTTRWGRKRKSVRLTPVELGERVASFEDARIAIVFGNESSGLTDAELRECDVVVTIPSSEAQRSINLSHAVQIVCYEIYSRLWNESGSRFYRPIDRDSIESLVESIVGNMHSIGLGEREASSFLRDILSRAALSQSEAARLRRLFDKLAGIARRRRSSGHGHG